MAQVSYDYDDERVGKLMRVKPNYYALLEGLNWHKGVSDKYEGQTGRVLFVFHGSRPDHICLKMDSDGEEIGFPFEAVQTA